MRDQTTIPLSIIVPTYQRGGLLAVSLTAQAEAAAAAGGELVVVVNGHADGLALEIASILPSGVARVLQLPSNVGFGGGCNAGAWASHGKFILFSNDDFVPGPTWVSALLARAESIAGDCIVGSSVVSFSGEVLDGAGVLGRDLSVRARDRGRTFSSLAWHPATEVDFVTGCGLLSTRTLFEQLNGFDPMFQPAYFEDVDLCLRARIAGAPVVHEPQAWGLHREGLSSDPLRSPLFERSRTRFLSRWSERSLPQARQRPPLRLSRRVLVVDDRLPTATAGSGFSRMFREVELFAQNDDFDVDVLAMLEPFPASPASSGLANVVVVSLDEALAEISAGSYAAVLISRPHNVQRARRVIQRAKEDVVPVVYDAEALFHRRERMLVDHGRASERDYRTALRADRRAVGQVDAVIALTETEAEIVRSWSPNLDVGVSLPLSGTMSTVDAGGRFLPAGTMLASWLDGEDSPNVQAFSWIVETVLPIVRDSVPGYRLVVTGGGPPASVRRPIEGIDLIGTREMSAVFSFGSVSICANDVQAGVSMKLLDSIASGVPVVARSSCAESLPQSVRRFIRVADSPNEFAKHLIELSNVDAWNMALGDIQSAQAALTNDQQPVNVIMGKWLDRWGVDAVSSDRLPVVPGFDRVSVQRIEQQVEQVLVQASAPEQASWVDLVERLAAAEARSDAIERSEVWRATAPIRRVGNALRSNAPWLNARLRSGRLADCLRRKLGSPRR